MTDELRVQLRQVLAEHGLTQAALAAAIGTDRHTVNRALSSNGTVPPIWQKMLEAEGVELVLRPKAPRRA